MIKIKKKIITAINNPNLNNRLKEEKYLDVIGRDLQYKEAILEMIEINKIDIIILNENLPGKIKSEELIKKIKLKNEKIKIILILEKEDIDKEIKLNKIYNVEIYYNNKINIKELIKIINEKEINKEELKKEIKKLENIIKENNYKLNEKNKKINQLNYKTEKNQYKNNKKRKYNNIKENKLLKIITIEGSNKKEQLIFAELIANAYNKKFKNKKILILDFYFPEKNNFKNINNNKIINNENKIIEKINILKNNKNINIENIKKLIINKINFNIYFFQNFYLIYNIKNINYKLFQKILYHIKNNYSIILINLENNYQLNQINEKIIENSDINYLILKANIQEIKEIKNIKNKYQENKLKIIINKNNKQKINKEIIKKLLNYNKKINLIKIKENNNKILLIKKINNYLINKKIKNIIN